MYILKLKKDNILKYTTNTFDMRRYKQGILGLVPKHFTH